MMNKYAPEVVIRRLPKYYTQLIELESEGVQRISSLQLSKRMGLNASQIRQDLNYFGGFGQQGYGYPVDNLKEKIAQILGLYENKKMVIIGAGNLGRAIAQYGNFVKSGFETVALFDTDSSMIGKKIDGISVFDVEELADFCDQNCVHIGIICTPKAAAQQVADTLDAAGVPGIWNFAPCDLQVNEAVIEDVRLSDSLFVLNYKTEHGIFD